MKKMIYVIIVLLTFLAPVKRADVAKLLPVEVVVLRKEGEKIALETDLGDVGIGNTAEEALENLKVNAIGIVYLDTAHYLLIEPSMENEVGEIRQNFKKSVKIGTYLGGDIKQAAKYLDAHQDAAKPNINRE